jgi:hypothetical protein
MFQLMQKGGGFGLYALPMLHDRDYKPEPFTI